MAAWVQPTGGHDAYALGAVVTHEGKTWESTVAGNVWEPGVSGWREVAPAEPSLRELAVAAHEAATNATENAARAALAPVINGVEVDLVEQAGPTLIFTDGDLHLSASETADGWLVRLVERVDGQWTMRSGSLASLADLGAALVALT